MKTKSSILFLITLAVFAIFSTGDAYSSEQHYTAYDEELNLVRADIYVDGDQKATCLETGCHTTDGAWEVVEGQKLEIKFECAYHILEQSCWTGGGQPAGCAVVRDETISTPSEFTMSIEDTNDGDYDGILETTAKPEFYQGKIAEVPYDFVKTYGSSQTIEMNCSYKDPQTNAFAVNDNQITVSANIDFKNYNPYIGMQVSAEDTSIDKNEETTVTVEFWGEIEEVCQPDESDAFFRTYYNCDFFAGTKKSINIDNAGPKDGLEVTYVKTVYSAQLMSPQANRFSSIKLPKPATQTDFSFLNPFEIRMLHASVSDEALQDNSADDIAGASSEIVETIFDTGVTRPVVGDEYANDGKYTATYIVKGKKISDTNEQHKLSFALEPKDEYMMDFLIGDVVIKVNKPIKCGNEIVETGEECDDGNTTSGDGCSEICEEEILPTCGDDNVDAGEECDDGNNTNGDGCSKKCVIEFCGDGKVRGAEQCDDANTTNGDGCSSTCLIEVVKKPICGDGTLDAGEGCDDGNTTNGDGCSSKCKVEVDKPECGNGVIEGTEECDDGNYFGGDGCSSTCKIEESPLECGNGIVEAGEECDDGNRSNEDGCNSICFAEEVPGEAPVACTIENLQAYPTADFDNDLVPNQTDICPCSYNPSQYDSDGDGVGDIYYLKNENGCDNCPGIANGLDEDLVDVNQDGVKSPLDSDVRQVDSDGDGYGDVCDEIIDPCGDVDADADGVKDLCDNCPIAYNPDQNSSDQDGLGDSCDNCDLKDNADQLDADVDGVGDVCDNCATIVNESQEDQDDDAVGDACEANPQIITPEPEPVVGASYGAFGGACNCNLTAVSGSNAVPMLFSGLMGLLMMFLRRRGQ